MNVKSYDQFADLTIKYLGPDYHTGTLPTVIYFSISAEESLSLDPFNQPALAISGEELRIFSITLPGHHEGQDKFKAMEYWSLHLDELNHFTHNLNNFIDHLIKEKISLSNQIGTMGLSRGGFIATHLAAHKDIIACASFAPVTNLKSLLEFNPLAPSELLEQLHLKNKMDTLYNKKIRYYIGNRDTRVSTKSAFEWVFSLSDFAYKKRIRSPSIELFITPSIGQHGHGTLPHIFKEGALWLKKQIVK